MFVQKSTSKIQSNLNQPFPYDCDCGVGFYKVQDLIEHGRLEHPGMKFKSKKIIKSDGFNDKDILLEENTSTKDYDINKEEISQRKPNKSTQSSKSKKKEIRGIKCMYCAEECLDKVKLLKHVKSHTERPFACNVKTCLERFATEDLLDKHDKLVHKYTCTYCGKVFGTKGNVEVHLRIHTGEKPFTCTLCNKGFTQKAALKIHCKRHEGIKDHECRYCNKKFSSNANKVNHERTHTGEKPNICMYCNKPFADRSALTRHIRTHTKDYRYTCDICEKGFTDISGLNNHKIRHSRMEHMCEICKKLFYNILDMQKHLKLHAGNKDCKCHDCGKNFVCKQYLVKHWRKKHALKEECKKKNYFVLKKYLSNFAAV